MNDHDYYRYEDYLDEDYYLDEYDYHGSQEMSREEKIWFVLVFIIFLLVMIAGAFGGMSLF